MSAINVRDLKRMLDHLAVEALVVVVNWDEREIPVDSKWLFFDDRSKRFIIKGPLVYMDEQLKQELRLIDEIRARISGWQLEDSTDQRERLREIAELLEI